MNLFKKTLFFAAATVMMAGSANADTFTFTQITTNGSASVASQLTVEVTAGAGGTVDFTFRNAVGTASSITDIYFDDGSLLAIGTITDSGAGVAFAAPATPGNLPGGQAINFHTSLNGAWSLDSSSPGVLANGVNTAAEWVTVNFTLQAGKTFADTIAAMYLAQTAITQDLTGGLRIGLHVQGIGGDGGGSESFVSHVPDGGTTVALLGMGMLGLGVLKRRFTA